MHAVYAECSGALWVGTWAGGASRHDPGRGHFTLYRHDPDVSSSLPDNRVTAVAPGSSGAMWIGTARGLDQLDLVPTAAVRGFRHHRHDPEDPASLARGLVRSLCVDRDGSVWVGTLGGGLDRLDPAPGSFIHHLSEAGNPRSLASDEVQDILEDRSGNLWIATAEGLHRLDRQGGGFERFVRDDDREDDLIYAVVDDDQGRLWMSTNRGLLRFDPAAGHWATYDTDDGLQGLELTQTTRARHPDGWLYFGGPRGLNAFRPTEFQSAVDVPPVVLTSFEVFGQPMDFGQSVSYLEEIELDHRQTFFSIGYAALSFTRSDQNRYAYRLEGFDADWVDVGTRRLAVYTNVSSGDYVFRVRGSNADGVWNEDGRSLRVVVRRPPWKTWWAIVLYSLAGTAGLAMVARVQRRKSECERAAKAELELRGAERTAQVEDLNEDLRARNADLESFTYAVSHDLKSPLVTIKGFLGFLLQDATAGDTERLNQDVDRIGGAVDKMQRLIDDLLALARAGTTPTRLEEISLGEIVEEALAAVSGKITEIRADVVVADDLPLVFGERILLIQVAQNLIDNSLKYMGDQKAPRIEVGSRRDAGQERVIFVRDNGGGIDLRHQDEVFVLFQRFDTEVEGTGVGLALLKRIVERHGGRIWVESDGVGQGSTFCFTLPGDVGSGPDG